MLQLTDSAVMAVKAALQQANGPAAGLRIMVEAGGCAGFKYMMGLEAGAKEGDSVIQQDGVMVFIDSTSQPLVSGMTIDFVSTLEQSGFIFENPNATSKCACGKSFG